MNDGRRPSKYQLEVGRFVDSQGSLLHGMPENLWPRSRQQIAQKSSGRLYGT